MNSQVYLGLVRKMNPHLPVPMQAAQFLKNLVLGDSLDVPFMKFIRVQSISHGIAFGASQSAGDVDGQWTKEFFGKTTAQGDRWLQQKSMGSYVDKGKVHYQLEDVPNPYRDGKGANWRAFKGIFSSKNNQFAQMVLPEHGALTFTKNLDIATPELAFGCTAQEPFSLAVFFFRRRIGAGIKGVRLPYFALGLRNCLITEWHLDDDTEKVNLNYKQVAWWVVDQAADINAPTGSTGRYWDASSNSGGESGLSHLVALIATALTAATAAIPQ